MGPIPSWRSLPGLLPQPPTRAASQIAWSFQDNSTYRPAIPHLHPKLQATMMPDNPYVGPTALLDRNDEFPRRPATFTENDSPPAMCADDAYAAGRSSTRSRTAGSPRIIKFRASSRATHIRPSVLSGMRSEERRVGKEGRSRWL